ncbi:aminoacyl tRNA synthase complex-interacting multifunctional protein 2 [Cimex lectularius]|uniref:Aminoacyl tRNA synthase complex-interacting multifunctional protein 2 n=1 Tax=Cimex lectularius TaxID=79782 RepID=A0A8I6RKP4_CIMLE|nr:aminoacyl tRNA synthase complex-interacting multifunctional protein 2 [Cimex lectularius]
MSKNGPLTMYRMKPLFDLDGVAFDGRSGGMYRMRDVHGDGGGRAEETLETIQQRQQLLLKRIDDLKKLLEAIKALTRTPKIANGSPSKMTLSNPDFSKLGFIHDIVLNVNPLYPPYSLLGLTKLWDWFACVNYTWHVHSSVRTLPENAKSFQDKLTGENSKESPLNITFVWKNVSSNCELVVSPIKSVPVLGEVNFLRFLNKFVSPELDVLNQAVQDGCLDACHALSYSGSDKGNDMYFAQLSERLDKSEWLMGDTVTVVDIAAWSTMKKMKLPNLKPKLNEWFKKCDEFVNSR